LDASSLLLEKALPVPEGRGRRPVVVVAPDRNRE
jgi:hypothetical protein